MDLNELQQFVGKDVRVLFTAENNGTEEQFGQIKVATVAGVGWTQKGKPGAELKKPEDFYEVELAAAKPKAVTQKKLKPIAEGQMRQHLADKHGTSLQWCKSATEQQAVDFHKTIDHSDLGHNHEAKDKPADERTEALSDEAGEQASA
jgi:hypothetical protein